MLFRLSDDEVDSGEEDADGSSSLKVPWCGPALLFFPSHVHTSHTRRYIVSNKHPLRQRWDLCMVFLILYTFFFLPARIIIGFGGGSDNDSAADFTDPWTLRCGGVARCVCRLEAAR